MTLFGKKIAITIGGILFVFAWVIVAKYNHSIYPYLIYQYNRIYASDEVGFQSACFLLPDYWWVEKNINNNALMVMRVSSNTYAPVVTLTVQNHDIDFIKKILMQEELEDEGEPMRIKKLSGTKGRFDVYWVFPSINIIIAGYKFSDAHVNYSQELISVVGACTDRRK